MTLVQVGRVGRPHGIRGEVTVTPTTDDPNSRFAVGSALLIDPSARGPLTLDRNSLTADRRSLTVAGARRSGPVFVVAFDGFDDRNAAETLRGTLLFVDTVSLPEPDDEDEFYDHQLVGLAVLHVDGRVLGEVSDVLHPPAAPVLQVTRPDGTDELVPFVRALVPEVDLGAGRLVVAPPDGMFE